MPTTAQLLSKRTVAKKARGPAPLTKPDEERRDALVGRLFGAGLQAFELQAVYLGRRLGYYEALARDGAATSRQLAKATGTNERYAREWLEQQAVAGILEVAKPSGDAQARAYALPAGHREVLLNETSPFFLAFMARYLIGTAQRMDDIVKAFRTGGGVAWSKYGPDISEAQAEQNRPFFLHALAGQYLPQISDVDARLRAEPPARVADFMCGAGWSSIALAKAYPRVRVDGFDLDARTLHIGRVAAKAEGLDDRVRFFARDTTKPGVADKYDLVLMVESVHDLSRPVDVLAAARRLLAPGGSVLVIDEKALEEFTAPGPDSERFFYAVSLVACLPNGLAEKPSAATGTVMRPSQLRSFASQAGFRRFEVLPLEHDFFRFYRLRP